MEAERLNSKDWVVEVSSFLYSYYCCDSHQLCSSHFCLSVVLGIGGGSSADAQAALPGSSSTKKHVGSFHGYVMIRKITPTESPSTSLSPSSSSLPSSTPTTSLNPTMSAKPSFVLGGDGPGQAGKSGKKDGKTGKTETEAIFT